MQGVKMNKIGLFIAADLFISPKKSRMSCEYEIL